MPDRTPRKRKTPRERATEALERAERELTVAQRRAHAAKAAAESAAAEVGPLAARRDHLAQDPALSDPIPESDTPLELGTTTEGTTDA